MLIAALCFVSFAAKPSATWQLWAGALTMAIGFASSLPCAITLPAEAGVPITPSRLLTMNLAGSLGETLMPFLLGIIFQSGRYRAFGATLVALNVVILGATAVARRAAPRSLY